MHCIFLPWLDIFKVYQHPQKTSSPFHKLPSSNLACSQTISSLLPSATLLPVFKIQPTYGGEFKKNSWNNAGTVGLIYLSKTFSNKILSWIVLLFFIGIVDPAGINLEWPSIATTWVTPYITNFSFWSIWSLCRFFLKKRKFKKHEAQNAEILRNI